MAHAARWIRLLLERIDPLGDPDDPFNWKASASLKGTPGQANSSPPTQSVELNEILAAGVSANGFVELRNKTGSPVDISGWQVQTPAGTEAIPDGTSIPANAVYSISIAGLPSNAGTVRVFTSPALTTQIDALRWGNQVSGYSIGKIGGTWQLCTPTPGNTNAAAQTAPSAAWQSMNGSRTTARRNRLARTLQQEHLAARRPARRLRED
jgi:hypothetical protein